MKSKAVYYFDGKNGLNGKCSGFSLLELVIVTCLIGLLFAFSASQYQKRIQDTRKEVVLYQSKAFKRIIDNTQAISALQKSNPIDLGTGAYVYIHESGWPFSAGFNRQEQESEVSVTSCRSLWFTLFTSPSQKNDNSDTKPTDDFGIFLVNNYICRYKPFGEQEESYFFDYDVRTGTVVTSTGEVL